MDRKSIVIGFLVVALLGAVVANIYVGGSQGGNGVGLDGCEIITVSPTDQASFVDNWICVSRDVDGEHESDYYYFKKSDYELLFNKSYVGVPAGGYVFPEALESFELKVKENKGQGRIDNATDGKKSVIRKFDVKEVL